MSPPPLEQYQTWDEVKYAAETFRLFCSIKQTTFDKLEVIRDLHPRWQDSCRMLLVPGIGTLEMRLEVIGVKDTDGTVHYVGYFNAEAKGKYYVSLPIFKERA